MLEDLVDVLVGYGLIRYTGLSVAARYKLHTYAEIRAKLGSLRNLMGDDELRLLL